MALNQPAMLALAQRLIGENGRDIVVRKLNKDASDAAKPWRGSATPASPGGSFSAETMRAVSVMPNSMIELGLTTMAHASLNQAASALYIVAPNTPHVDITNHDEVVDGDKTYRIVRVEEMRPADLTLLYFVTVDG